MRWDFSGRDNVYKKFALFPICIHEEVRWLETVYIQKYWGSGWCGGWHKEFITKYDYERLKETIKSSKDFDLELRCCNTGNCLICPKYDKEQGRCTK